MRAILGCALGLVLAVTTGAAADEKKAEKIDAKKLVGKWEPANAPKGATIVIELTKDGKAKMSFEFGDKKDSVEGTYKVDGNKLTLTRKVDGKDDSETMTVDKLTDDEMVTVDEKGKKETLKRIKDKK
ncbi:MAG: hypothetical protein JWO38_2646 [Gemmataceae bacterium]|nr:hypothetical protein [Gemmataceae bacterium]